MKKGNSVITVPVMLVFAIVVLCSIGILLMNILKPYIMYEKLLSTTLRYMFVLEEYGYLTDDEIDLLIEELAMQGFKREDISVEATQTIQDYGDTVYLSITYNYSLDLPLVKEQSLVIDNKTYTNSMKVVKYGVCKR